ncbi:MAG: hypothetical protein GTO53_07775 [Planctomycetales bacterium]|nr:hypothetical protein [Planctomycetales bacterium]NIM09034.1 hypothetical protein [Planctomycetales bacterium]NIN08497.1 hypothetical protein [Planctomycetales bacterium]NIN77631.1 hypothetical protein [Planctomycetales bacterium]NIO34794.1 hypothetical protein [Planctomycetales bacterium]
MDFHSTATRSGRAAARPPRRRPLAAGLLPASLLLLLAGGHAAATDFANLLPATTNVWVRTADVAQLEKGWQKTGLARLLDDQAMRPFRNEIDRFVRRRTPAEIPPFGLTWQQLKSVAAGEACAAILKTPSGQPAWVILIHVEDRGERVVKVLDDLRQAYRQAGARVTEKVTAGATVTVCELPPTEPGAARPVRAYFLKNDILVVTDNAAVVSQFSGRREDGVGETLGQQAAFRYCQRNCPTRFPHGPAHLQWFLDPFASEALLSRSRGDDERDSWQWARKQGFTAIRGMGGAIRFEGKKFDTLHRIAVYAPGPFDLAAGMLHFPNVGQLELPGWLPANVARLTSLQWDLSRALNGYGHLFDDWYGEGEPGVFEDVLAGIRDDPGSPGVDVRKDLVANLNGTVVSAALAVNEGQGLVHQTLFAVGVGDRQAVATALRNLLESDPDVIRREVAGQTLWVFRDRVAAQPTVDRQGTESSFGPDLSNYALCQWGDWLLVATRAEVLQAILQPPPQAKTLADQPEYQQVMQILTQAARSGNDLRRIARPHLDLQVPYQLLRVGKLPHSRALRDRLLASLLGLEANGDSQPSAGNGQSGAGSKNDQHSETLDFTTLPPFDLVKDHFTTSAWVGQRRGDGWALFRFTLGK